MMDESTSPDGVGTAHNPTEIKIPPTGGKSLTQIQKETDQVIEKNTGKFIKILAEEIEEIRDVLGNYSEDTEAEKIDEVYQRVHNLRGQGTLFNYPLVTEIGGCFCNYINGLEDGQRPRKEVVHCFLQSMSMVQSQDIKGEGSGQVLELLKLMKLMVAKLAKK